MGNPYLISVATLSPEIGVHRDLRLEALSAPDWSAGVVSIVPKPLLIDVGLSVIAEGVLAHIVTEVDWVAPCSRCAEEVSGTVEVDTRSLYYYADASFADEDDDGATGVITDGHIDLEPALRDEVVLGIPSLPLCDPLCPGLCDVCGVSWDDLPDDHNHGVRDPRFAVLADMFKESGGASDSKEEGV